MATGLRPFTVPARVATLGGGVLAIMMGRRFSPPAAIAAAVNGAWLWATLGGAAIIWELQAFVQHPRSDHPTVSSLTNELLRSHLPRSGAMLVWLAAGWWLARR